MALLTFPSPLLLNFGPDWETTPAMTSDILDLAGEKVCYMGQVYWDGEPASKSMTTAGSKIVWEPSSTGLTWATSGSTLRVGLQGLDATNGAPPRGDGSWLVYKDLVQGTDTITGDTVHQTAMAAGTGVTLNHGANVAVVIEMTVRNGTDLVRPLRVSQATAGMWPAISTYLGASWGIQHPSQPAIMLVADDGTIGWLAGSYPIFGITSRTFDSGTASADEYGNSFVFPYDVEVAGFWWSGRFATSTGTGFDAFLYTDPTGTPVEARSYFNDTSFATGTASGSFRSRNTIIFSSPIQITANTKFAITLRPQDTNSDVAMYEMDWTQYPNAAKALIPGGATVKKATRLNATGALTETNDTAMAMGLLLTGLGSDGAGGGTTIISGRGSRTHLRM